MITLPVIAQLAPPMPPAPPVASAAPAIFTRATGPRRISLDAFYVDERNLTLPKGNHPVQSFYNIFTRFIALPPSYANARTNTFGKGFKSVLNDDPPGLSAVASVLPQKFSELGTNAATAKTHFNEERPHFIFVPKKLKDTFDARPAGNKPKARVSLFFGVEREINLFGLRRFFADSDDAVLITAPGVEAGWTGYGKAWGIGITTAMINELMTAGGLPGIDFTIEIMAGYSTGYRGVNLTLINKLIPLTALKRIIYYDAFYNHDDYPQPPASHAFHKKLTRWAVKEALTASPGAEIHVYAYTHPGGVPRSKDDGVTPVGPREALIADHGAKIRFFDLEFNFQGKPPIDSDLEKIGIARLIQGAIGDYMLESEVGADILALINLLPARGSFSISGRSGFTDLYAWVKVAPQSNALQGFPTKRAFDLIVQHKLLGTEWTTSNMYEFRHRNFVQEIGKEGLLP